MYREIGIFVVFLLLVSVILIISALYIGRGRLKEKSSFAAGIVAGVLDFYYKPMMGWIQVFSGSPQRLHEIMVHTKNEAAKKKFRLTEKKDHRRAPLYASQRLSGPCDEDRDPVPFMRQMRLHADPEDRGERTL